MSWQKDVTLWMSRNKLRSICRSYWRGRWVLLVGVACEYPKFRHTCGGTCVTLSLERHALSKVYTWMQQLGVSPHVWPAWSWPLTLDPWPLTLDPWPLMSNVLCRKNESKLYIVGSMDCGLYNQLMVAQCGSRLALAWARQPMLVTTVESGYACLVAVMQE